MRLTAVESVSMAVRRPALTAVNRFIRVHGPSAYREPPPLPISSVVAAAAHDDGVSNNKGPPLPPSDRALPPLAPAASTRATGRVTAPSGTVE